jgi:hypothetical protein
LYPYLTLDKNDELKIKVGVEIEKGKKMGCLQKKCVCEAVRIVMDSENEVGRELEK